MIKQSRAVRLGRVLVLAALVSLSIFTAGQIALKTHYDVHPDEYAHVDTLCFFASHLWPPDLNTPGLQYGGYGWSRVYSREVVYIIYGRLYDLLHQPVPAIANSPSTTVFTPTARQFAVFLPLVSRPQSLKCDQPISSLVGVFRFLNVTLLAITMVVLLLAGRRHLWVGVAALLMMCVPQVLYLYSYANSDAWGLSMSLFLVAFVLVKGERLFRSYWNALGLAVLTGLVLLSKQTFWISIPFAFFLAGQTFLRSAHSIDKTALLRGAGWLGLFAVVTGIIAVPLLLYYPYTQGDFSGKIEEMKEQRAFEGFKPSHPTAPGVMLAERGIPFFAVVTDPVWRTKSTRSAYAMFGYMNVDAPQLAYRVSTWLFLTLMGATYLFAIWRWRALSEQVRWGLVAAPIFVALAVFVSLLHSWQGDFQPQGRYLFGAFMPAVVMLAGTVATEPRWLRRSRALVFIVLYALCQGVLWISVLNNTALLK